EIDKIKEELSRMTGKEIFVDIQEIKTPELDAQLVAENIALQLERRISFRRAMKKAVQTAMDFGADGIKIRCAGRLGGAELARTEMYHEGRVPLHTLRANIDYGFAEASTVYGKLGVSCWMDTKQIEAARVAITRFMKRRGKVWLRVFPDKSITKKPLEVRMGTGKGGVESWVAVIRPANVLFEVDGVTEAVARESMRLASAKLPIKTRFISRHRAG